MTQEFFSNISFFFLLITLRAKINWNHDHLRHFCGRPSFPRDKCSLFCLECHSLVLMWVTHFGKYVVCGCLYTVIHVECFCCNFKSFSHFFPQHRMFLLDLITDPLYLSLYHSAERCKALSRLYKA